jgi:molecular chaperone DnaK
MKLGEAMYKAQQEQAAPTGEAEGAAHGGGNDDEKVVDADFTEVKEDDRKAS